MSRRETVLLGVALGCGAVVLGRAVLPNTVWLTVASLLIGGAISAVISWYFYKQAGEELRREVERLRGLTIKLFQILDGANVIEVKEWDPETGEPSRWRVVKTIELLWNVEPPTRRKEQLKKRMRRARLNEKQEG